MPVAGSSVFTIGVSNDVKYAYILYNSYTESKQTLNYNGNKPSEIQHGPHTTCIRPKSDQ